MSEEFSASDFGFDFGGEEPGQDQGQQQQQQVDQTQYVPVEQFQQLQSQFQAVQPKLQQLENLERVFGGGQQGQNQDPREQFHSLFLNDPMTYNRMIANEVKQEMLWQNAQQQVISQNPQFQGMEAYLDFELQNLNNQGKRFNSHTEAYQAAGDALKSRMQNYQAYQQQQQRSAEMNVHALQLDAGRPLPQQQPQGNLADPNKFKDRAAFYQYYNNASRQSFQA